MGRYSRKQSACAGKESAEDFGKRREDQREISAHLQLNYANTPPCGCAGVTFLFSLIRPLYKSFIGFLLSGLPICITPCNSITQIPTRLDTGGGYFFTLSYSSIVQIFIGFLLSGLPLSTRLCKIPPRKCGGILHTFFSFRRSTYIIFLLPLYGDSLWFPIISTAQNNLVP